MGPSLSAGVDATTQLVRQFAQTANVKLQAAGPLKTRTQVQIEQIAAETVQQMRSGQAGAKVAYMTLSALLDVQSHL